MIRTEWKFEYPAKQVAEGAKKKAEFHRSREAYWQEEFEKAYSEVKASVQVRDTPIANQMSKEQTYAVTSAASNRMSDIDVSVDPAAKRHMENTRSKLNQHKKVSEEFEAYYAALSQNYAVVIPLDVEDIKYFGLSGWDPDKDIAKDE